MEVRIITRPGRWELWVSFLWNLVQQGTRVNQRQIKYVINGREIISQKLKYNQFPQWRVKREWWVEKEDYQWNALNKSQNYENRLVQKQQERGTLKDCFSLQVTHANRHWRPPLLWKEKRHQFLVTFIRWKCYHGDVLDPKTQGKFVLRGKKQPDQH